MSPINLDPERLLTLDEIATVLAELGRRGRRNVHTRQNLAIFALLVGCGLRPGEAAALTLDKVRVDVDDPHLYVRCLKKRPKTDPKTGRKRPANVMRTVPIIDVPIFQALLTWKQHRRDTMNAAPADPYLCTLAAAVRYTQAHPGAVPIGDRTHGPGRQLNSGRIWDKLRTALRAALPPERAARIRCIDCRHTFASHALAAGATLPAVRDWLGHSSVSTTNIYLQALNTNRPQTIVTKESEPPS